MTALRSSPAETARALIRACDRAALSTAASGLEGWPYGSLVLTACRFDGAPLLLISQLAAHTANLAADPRLSLLYDGTAGYDDPLEGPRVSALGRVEAEPDPAAMVRFLRRHPGAELYAGFGDFALYRVAVERAHLVAGFGRIHWIPGDALQTPPAPALAQAEQALLDEIDSRTAAGLAAGADIASSKAANEWRVTGIDPLGLDLRRGGLVLRRCFTAPATTPEAARNAIADLACA